MLIGPAVVADRADIDEADLELGLGGGGTGHQGQRAQRQESSADHVVLLCRSVGGSPVFCVGLMCRRAAIGLDILQGHVPGEEDPCVLGDLGDVAVDHRLALRLGIDGREMGLWVERAYHLKRPARIDQIVDDQECPRHRAISSASGDFSTCVSVWS